MTFNFSALSKHPPRGFTVDRADDELHLRHKKTGYTFKLLSIGKSFPLYIYNPKLSPRDFLFNSFEEVTPALHYLGYGKRDRPRAMRSCRKGQMF